jgi:O-antigen/teichoic acid export membrane protein
MDKNSLTHKTLKNLSYSTFSYLWPVLFALFITPVLVFNLGARDYGVFIFINSILSLIGLLDFGISTAAQKYITEYSAAGLREKLRNLIGTMNTLFTAMGIVGLTIMATVGYVGCGFFNCTAETTFSYPTLFLLAGLIFLVDSVNSIYNIIPYAMQRFDLTAKLGVAKVSLQQLTALVLVLQGFSLYAIFISALLYSIAFSFVSRSIALKIMNEARFYFRFHKESAKEVYAFGLSLFITNLSTNSLINLDKFVIPIMLGPSRLTYYSLPGAISSKVPGLIGAFSSVIFPVTTQVASTGDQELLKRLYLRSFRLVAVLSASMAIPIFILSKEILRFWLDETFVQQSSLILMIFAVICFVLSLQSHMSNFLYGLGKLRAITVLSMIMAVLNVLLLALLIPRFDIIGAAWAYLISILPVFYLIYYLEKKYLGLTRIFLRHFVLYAKILIVGLALFAIIKLLLAGLITNLFSLLVMCGLSVVIYLALYWAFGFFKKEDVSDVLAFVKGSLAR